jgi:hypothetical protein
MSKAQVATEYIVVVGVVIVIAVIVVATMGGLPGIGGGAGKNANSAYWKTLKVGIMSAAVGSTDKFSLRNNDIHNIQVIDINLTASNGSVYQLFTSGQNKGLGVGEAYNWGSPADIACASGELQSYDVLIKYRLRKTNAYFVISPRKKLELECN